MCADGACGIIRSNGPSGCRRTRRGVEPQGLRRGDGSRGQRQVHGPHGPPHPHGVVGGRRFRGSRIHYFRQPQASCSGIHRPALGRRLHHSNCVAQARIQGRQVLPRYAFGGGVALRGQWRSKPPGHRQNPRPGRRFGIHIAEDVLGRRLARRLGRGERL